MKRAVLVVTAVVIAAALAITATRPSAPPPTAHPKATAPTGAQATRPGPPVSRAEVQAQDDEVTAAERGRIRRGRLLDATLVTAAAAHGVSILTGPARPTDRAPQDMVITPAPGLTVREIAAGVSQICRGLEDPCVRRDYRFLIQTPTGRALLPARLIDPKDPSPMPARSAPTAADPIGGAR